MVSRQTIIVIVLVAVLAAFILLFAYKQNILPAVSPKNISDRCTAYSVVKMFADNENPTDISAYCNKNFKEDKCRLIFYDFILYNIKNNVAGALDPNSGINLMFFSYLQKAQPDILQSDFAEIGGHFSSGKPIDKPGFAGLNAAITKDSKYCAANPEENKICVNELLLLNAKTFEDCENIDEAHIYLLCVKDASPSEYLSQIASCSLK